MNMKTAYIHAMFICLRHASAWHKKQGDLF